MNNIDITYGDDATFTTGLCPQSIYFDNPGTQIFGTAPQLWAPTNAAAQVTFTSSTTDVCTITSDGYLTFVTAGSCTINADAPGDNEYAVPATVSQTFTVSPIVPDAPASVTGASGNQRVILSWAAPTSTGGVSITGYHVTVATTANGVFSDAVGGCVPSLTMASTARTCSASSLVNSSAYYFKVLAINSVGAGVYSVVSGAVTPALPQWAITTAPAPEFRIGVAGGSYIIQVTNAGGATDENTQVTVIDTLPVGMTANDIDNTQAGWACQNNVPASGQIRCTRNDVVLGNASYPAILITVDVASDAPNNLDEATNTVSATGGGATTTATDNPPNIVSLFIDGFD